MFAEGSIDFCIRKLILSALKLSSVDSKEKKFNNKLIFFLQKTCTCLVTLGEMKCLGGKYLCGILISLHLQNKYTEGKVLLFFAWHLPYIWIKELERTHIKTNFRRHISNNAGFWRTRNFAEEFGWQPFKVNAFTNCILVTMQFLDWGCWWSKKASL